MDLPEELLCLTLRNAITRSPWPGGWAVFRLVSRRGWAVFLEVAVYERGGGGAREKLLWRLQKATWAFFFSLWWVGRVLSLRAKTSPGDGQFVVLDGSVLRRWATSLRRWSRCYEAISILRR